jgi:hypothetical protein
MRPEALKPWMPLLALLGLMALLRLPSLDLPLDRDEGEYATLAQQWAAPGQCLPYRDLMEVKPPLAPALYALAFKLAGPARGPQLLSLRLLDLAWHLACLSLLYWLLLSLAGPWPAALGSLLWALGACHPQLQGFSANTESWACLPLLAALCLLLPRPAPSALRLALAGLALGLASLARQPMLAFLPALAWASGPGWRRSLKPGAWLLAGSLLAWALCLALFALQGGWPASGALLRCVWAYGASYAARPWPPALAPASRAGLALLWILGGLLPAALAGAIATRPAQRRAALALLLAGALACLPGGHFYPHYFLVPLLALALAAGLGFGALRKAWRALAAAGLLFFGAGFALAYAPLWRSHDAAEASLALYHVPAFSQAARAAQELQQQDPQAGRLWMWGSEPELYFLSGRRPACRFLYAYPFTGEAPAWPGGEQELLAALDDPAVSAVAVSQPLSLAGPGLGPRLAGRLNARFPRQVQVPGFTLGFKAPSAKVP